MVGKNHDGSFIIIATSLQILPRLAILNPFFELLFNFEILFVNLKIVEYVTFARKTILICFTKRYL